MAINRRFGSTGSIWSAVPRQRWFGNPEDKMYTGGTAVGLDLTGTAPALVTWAWTPTPFRSLTQVLVVFLSPDSRPVAEGFFNGTLVIPLSDDSQFATPLASCAAPAGGTAVLMRVLDPLTDNVPPHDQILFAAVPPRYLIRVAQRSRTGAGLGQEFSISPTWLYDSDQGNVRLMTIGSDFLVVSTSVDHLRIVRVAPNGTGTLATPIHLGGAGSALPGLTRLDIASLRFDGTWLSIALAAYLNHPGVGPVSVGALLRVSTSGARDTTFADNGLWVSPLTIQFRQFICAGECAGGIAGIQGNEVIAYGIAPGGSGLDNAFGESGVFRQSLGGGALSFPVTGGDGAMSCVFARRSNGSVAGCRFNGQGLSDSGFGAAGLASVASDGAPSTPADMKVDAGRIVLALTRQVEGVECDRVPAIAVLNFNSGQPDDAFGAGGFAFQSAIGTPAVVCPDGVTYYAERKVGSAFLSKKLRRADGAGRFERVVPVIPDAMDRSISSLWALDDGSLLVGGDGNPAWIEKLTPAGAPDTSFGVNGIATPRPGISGRIRVLGTRADGRIAIQFYRGQGTSPGVIRDSVGLLHPEGTVDTSYVPPGDPYADGGNFLELRSFSHLGPDFSNLVPFLDADGSIICALFSEHQSLDSPDVLFALRRITPAGTYDANFGLGVPSVNPPATPRRIVFDAPAGGSGGSDSYSKVQPVGFAWMGGLLYVVARGIAGGVIINENVTSASYDVLVVTRWNADGSKDTTFGSGFYSGFQEAGFEPERLDFRPKGVLPLSGTRLMVFGEAGHAESITVTAGDQTYTDVLIRRPEPALFRVSHPNGIDLTFGQDGAEWLPMQEFEAQTIAARVLPWRRRSSRVRFVCADFRTTIQASAGNLRSNFGGIGEFFV